jgi:hypothetical protein
MIGVFFRLFFVVLVLAGLFILFAYAFVAALVLTPIVFLLLLLFGRKPAMEWWVVRREGRGPSPRPGAGPVIDHDPDDLPPPNDGQR